MAMIAQLRISRFDAGFETYVAAASIGADEPVVDKTKRGISFRRAYSLKEYLEACSAIGRLDTYEESDEETETSSDVDTVSSFSTLVDDLSDVDEDADEDVSSTTVTPAQTHDSTQEAPVTFDQYVSRVCSKWEDRGDGYMYGLYPRHPEHTYSPWRVHYCETTYVRSWYPIRVPGSEDAFAPHFWSWQSMSTMSFAELEAMGLEFLPSSEPTDRDDSPVDFPRWDFAATFSAEDGGNIIPLHTGTLNTPSIMLSCPPEDDAPLPRTISETLASGPRCMFRVDLLLPGSLRDVKDSDKRRTYVKKIRQDWERLRDKEAELGGMLRDLLSV